MSDKVTPVGKWGFGVLLCGCAWAETFTDGRTLTVTPCETHEKPVMESMRAQVSAQVSDGE